MGPRSCVHLLSAAWLNGLILLLLMTVLPVGVVLSATTVTRCRRIGKSETVQPMTLR